MEPLPCRSMAWRGQTRRGGTIGFEQDSALSGQISAWGRNWALGAAPWHTPQPSTPPGAVLLPCSMRIAAVYPRQTGRFRVGPLVSSGGSKGARQCLVGRASFGQARASAPPPAFPHLRAKGLLSLLLPTRPPGAEVRNRAQRSSRGCGWALVQMAVGPMHASKTCNAKRSRTRWRSRRAPPPLSPLSQFHKGLPLCSG